MRTSEGDSVDVLVVGAGITGLSAAHAIRKTGRSVLVLEAASEVGGRMMTRERNGDRIEVGQQYLLSSYSNALALVDEVGMSDELVESPPEVIQYIDRKGRSRISRNEGDLLRLLGVRGAADLARFTLSYATLGKSFPAFAIAKDIPEYDRVSAHEGLAWAGETFRDYVLRPMCYSSAGTTPEHISLYDAVRLFRSHAAKPKHYGFLHGNASLARKLAEHVPVMLEAEVAELLLAGDRVRGVRLADGRTIDAGHVIVCTTPGAAARMTPDALSSAKRFLSEFHHTPLALAFFYLDRPLGGAAHSFGLAYPEKRSFNLSVNHTVGKPHLVPSGKGIISAWPAFPDGAELLVKPDEEILRLALSELELFYPGLSPDWVEHAEVVRHGWGYAQHLPGDYKRIIDFKAQAHNYKGLSYANADYNAVALEAGVVMGKEAAARAVNDLRAPA